MLPTPAETHTRHHRPQRFLPYPVLTATNTVTTSAQAYVLYRPTVPAARAGIPNASPLRLALAVRIVGRKYAPVYVGVRFFGGVIPATLRACRNHRERVSCDTPTVAAN